MRKNPDRTVEKSNPVYWDGVLDLVNLNTKGYRMLVEKLEHHEYKSLKIEFKNSSGKYPVIGMYQDDTVRVLATQIKDEKKTYLLLVEVMLDHNYETSPFMKAEVRDAYMDRHLPHFLAYIRKEEKKLREAEKDAKSDSRPGLYKAVMVHQNKVINLSSQQEGLLTTTNASLLVEGGPGAGKTVLAKALLDEELRRYTGSTTPETLVYITQSAALTRKTSELWGLQPHYNPYGKRVIFRTYDAIVKARLGLRDEALVGKERFVTWMSSNYLARAENKQNAKLRPHIEHQGKQKFAEQLYREFRILSGYDKAMYASKAHGAQCPSLFPDVELREWIVEAYQKYAKVLEASGQRDTALIAAEELSDISFDIVVVDEAQDLSLAQLDAAYRWGKRNKRVFLKDENQNVHGDPSNTDYILHLAKEEGMQRALLKGSFRCPVQVIHLANQVLAMKFFLTHGVKTKLQQCQIELTPEQVAAAQQGGDAVLWVESLEAIQNKEELLKKINESPDVLVVTSERYKDYAQQVFKKGLVLSIDEIHLVKGLQFAKVILYQVLDDGIYAQANEEASLPRGAEVMSADVPHHRPKEGQERPEYAQPLDRLFVALTRCAGEEDGSGQVVVIQKRGHKQEHLVDFLKKRTFGEKASTPAPAAVVVDVSQLKANTESNWLEQAQTVLENNNVAFASYIFKTKLNKTEDEFKQWQKGFEKAPSVPAEPPKETPVAAALSSAPASAKPSTSKKKDPAPKVLTTLEALYNAVIEKNMVTLRRLFKKDYPVSDVEHGHNKLLVYCLANPNIASFFFQTLEKQVFFAEFIANPAIPDMLSVMNPITKNPVIYDFIEISNEGVDAFNHLIKQKAFLQRLAQSAKFISALLKVCRTKELIGVDTSVIGYLSASVIGMELIEKMFADNELLNALVMHPDFVNQLTMSVGGFKKENKSPVLFNIAIGSTGGRVSLLQLFNHPVFYQRIFTSDEFIRIICQPNSRSGNIFSSILFWLLVSEHGMVKSFASRLGQDMGTISKLCQRDDFYTALLAILNPKNPGGYFSSIQYTSPLYWLMRQHYFKPLLDNLCNTPGFIEKLIEHPGFIDALIARRTAAAGVDFNGSVLSLCVSSQPNLLITILKHPKVGQQLLADHRFYDTACARFTGMGGAVKNCSFLAELLCYQEAIEVANLLYGDATFVKRLQETDEFIPSLLARVSYVNTKDCPPNVLFEMIRTDWCFLHVINLLKSPVFRAKLLRHEAFIDALTCYIKDKNHLFNQISALFLLCMQRSDDKQTGQDMFIDMCSDDVFFNKLITTPGFVHALVLKVPFDVEGGEQRSHSVLHMLLTTTKGRSLLTRMYENASFKRELTKTSPDMLKMLILKLEEAKAKTSAPTSDKEGVEQDKLPKATGNMHSLFASSDSPNTTVSVTAGTMQPGV